jgi:hypothetical protein
MGQEEDLVAQVTIVWYKDAGPVEEQSSVEAPRVRQVAFLQALEKELGIECLRAWLGECRR